MTALFGVTLALGAALLFAIQPMVARMALPYLGGAPSVWTACMLFFQAAVLAGYALAHRLGRWRVAGWQVAAFAALAAIGALGFPVWVQGDPDGMGNGPLAWLLRTLSAEVALPAVALAVTSPLLQQWFLRAADSGRDPYFLYAASNGGSLAALLGYPLLVEPWLPVSLQSRSWAVVYGVWGLLGVVCGVVMLTRWRGSSRVAMTGSSAAAVEVATGADGAGVEGDSGNESRPGAADRERGAAWWVWMGLAALPASLLQGCTLFLTTDVASVPLLWVVPLALYLSTFIVAFGRHGPRVVRVANRVLPYLAAGLAYMILVKATQPVLALVGLHLLFLFAAGVVCHGRLVALRPEATRLTSFYLALSVGGVLGGGFNAILAPLLFQSVAEYPLAIAACCLALPRRAQAVTERASWVRDLAWGVAVLTLVLVLGFVVPWFTEGAARLRDAFAFGLPAVACCSFLDRPRRLALALACVLLGGLWIQARWSGTFHAERNFFGVTKVTRSGGGEFHQLVHGNTIHGRQYREPGRQAEPLTYYHRRGPLGSLFEVLHRERAGPLRVAVIGLGVGTMASYARPGEMWTFYEIDPAVIRVARDEHWFTYLARTRAGAVRIVEGDARLRLAAEPDGDFDLVVLDAFSSDAIPVHLMTREALALYRAKLRPGGWLAAHISNRYLGLEPVFAGLAADAGWASRAFDDTEEGDYPGKEASHWIVMARSEKELGEINRLSLWVRLTADPRVSLWTDQRASVWEVFDWR